jgi:tetratricopeptide (TPR) repeat protein
VGEGKVLAESLRVLSYVATDLGDRARARQLLEEAVGVGRAIGYKREVAFALSDLAKIPARENALDRTEALLVESRSLAQESGDPLVMIGPLFGISWVQTRRGELGEARRTLDECLAIAQRLDAPWPIMFTRLTLGDLATIEGNLSEAIAQYRQALSVILDVHRGQAVYSLYCYAALCAARGDHRRAARLFGAGRAAPPTAGDEFDLLPRTHEAAEVEAARQALGQSAFAAAWAEGRAMTLEQAVAYALEEDNV